MVGETVLGHPGWWPAGGGVEVPTKEGDLMPRTAILGLVAALVVGLLLGCGDKNAPLFSGGSGGAGGGGAGGSNVSFAADIQPLLAKSCSCHVLGANAPALDTYANVKAAAQASSAAIADGTMPISGPLSAAEQALFDSWLAAGMPNN
jgi:hypothetical protein